MKVAALLYGLICYLVFFATFLYLIGFVGGVVVPTSLYSSGGTTSANAVLFDLALVLLFGLQHSIMARPAFKAVWTRMLPRPIERSTYVLVSSVTLLVIYGLWRPMPEIVWSIGNQAVAAVLWGTFAVGWLVVLVSTFLIDHFDLFGLAQVWSYYRGRPYQPPHFQETAFYKYVRHPLLLGFLIAFWAAPTMTLARLVFASAMTTYILVAIRIEERDLVRFHGREYEDYRRRVSMLNPFRGRKAG
jgi:protein-S-isoprenylcysteine O-methyltransferase Ste14